MRNFSLKACFFLFAVALPGCSVGPDYAQPELNFPDHWSAEASSIAAQVTAKSGLFPAFDDAVLLSLMQRAARSNLDLLAAGARLEQVRALRRKSFANFGPGISLGAEYRRSEESSTLASFPGGFVENKYSLGAELSWEIDLFGRLRRDYEAASADLGGAEAAQDAALLSALSEVAQEYVNLRTYQQRLEVGRRNGEAARQTVALVKKRLEAGMSSKFDFARAEALATEIEGRIPPLESAVQATLFRISLLLGEPPAALLPELSEPSPIPQASELPTLVIPSELIRRRPDIVVAERALASDTAKIGLAIGDLFPKFSLSGDFGYRSQESGSLVSNSNRGFSIAPGVSWSILSWTRTTANIRFARAKTQETFIAYKQVVLKALSEVESAWANLTQLQKRVALLSENLRATSDAAHLANQQYEAGLIDFLDKLESDKALYASQDAQLANLGDVAVQYISLCKALGGEFKQYKDQTDENTASAEHA